MNTPKQKLELTWIGKGEEPKLEPRILIEDPDLSYGDPNSGNMLIHGDNLLALKALEQDFAGKVKCIYIDPPYNTGNAFDHYDDGLENSIWLNLICARIKSLKQLLSSDGVLFVQIDDKQFARLYLMMCEIFNGDKNLKNIVVKMSESSGLKMAAVKRLGILPKYKEYIIVAKCGGVTGLFPRYLKKDKWDNEYNLYLSGLTIENRDKFNEIVGKNYEDDVLVSTVDKLFKDVKIVSVESELKRTGISRSNKEEWLYNNAWRICRTVASKTVLKLARQRGYMGGSEIHSVVSSKDKIVYLVKSGFNRESSSPRVQIIFADDNLMYHPGDLWLDISTTGLESEGGVSFKNGKKPEELIRRIVEMSTRTL